MLEAGQVQMRLVLFGLNGIGGMLHYTSQFANALAARHEVWVVIPSFTDTRFFNGGVNLIKIDAPLNMARFALSSARFWEHLALMRRVRRLSPDAVHFMDNHPWYVLYVRMLGRYPVFVTQHDPELHSGDAGFVHRWIINYTNEVLRKKARTIIVHGETLRMMLSSKGIHEERICVVPHGSYEFFTKFLKKKLPPEKDTILFFGRIVRYKGVDNLLKAVPIVLKKRKDLKVVIAGEGDFSIYSKFLTEDIKKNVRVINRYLPEEEVADLFQRAAFVVLPYDDATQSGIIPIAYSFHKPVITTRVGSLPEVVDEGETGFIVPPKDPERLAEAILELFGKDLEEMGNAAYARMKRTMDWDKIAETIVSAYRKWPGLDSGTRPLV
jgi:starch synthase